MISIWGAGGGKKASMSTQLHQNISKNEESSLRIRGYEQMTISEYEDLRNPHWESGEGRNSSPPLSMMLYLTTKPCQNAQMSMCLQKCVSFSPDFFLFHTFWRAEASRWYDVRIRGCSIHEDTKTWGYGFVLTSSPCNHPPPLIGGGDGMGWDEFWWEDMRIWWEYEDMRIWWGYEDTKIWKYF